MSNLYIDERLLDAAGLSDLPELYAYIKERYPKPLEQQPQPAPIGDQTLQQQVKNNDDIIFGSGDSNEEFEPLVPNAITKLDLSSQLERQSFLATSGSDPQLIVYGDRITLTASYATTGLFPGGGQESGYLFKSYPPEARPKVGDQVITLYKSSKKINCDANNEGKIDIIDTWNINGKGQFEAQSTSTNEASSEEPESRIDEFMINDFFLSSAYNTFYIVDDGTCKVCVFNLYFESKRLQGRTQEVGRIPDSVLPADGKKPQESIPVDSADVYKYCASGMYYL
ncbi:MAG: hypothetical protein EZS28_002324 [Streblomastix strix]|uniref:Uncharacterized protein n=1 Tax=Streblomastix strix TaxID=222440 RepID=A0A5J4X4N7_9EUKA|nr:MAG: hypothetical protein EZS28_002324 [Streblomastix strix]